MDELRKELPYIVGGMVLGAGLLKVGQMLRQGGDPHER